MKTQLGIAHKGSLLLSLCGLCACGAAEGAGDGMSLGDIAVALMAPDDLARCLEEWVTNRVNGREERRVFELAPGVDQTIELDAVPAGDVELSAYVTDQYDAGACSGNITYRAEAQPLHLVPGEIAYVSQHFLAQAKVVVAGGFETDIFEAACVPQLNVAIGADTSLSDPGWGGGTAYADLTDGATRYDDWARGLAFTGGPSGWAGEACGTRQTTIDLGVERSVEAARLYHHGDYHIPASDTLEYSADGQSWSPIEQERSVRPELRTDTEAGYYGATPTEHRFSAVTARYFRYSFDNCNMLQPTSDSHGWLYEFELLSCADE